MQPLYVLKESRKHNQLEIEAKLTRGSWEETDDPETLACPAFDRPRSFVDVHVK